MATILVTGANRGIGLALVQNLVARGDRVIAVCRKSSDALDATGAQVESGIDVTDTKAVQALAQRLADERIDVLIPGAGILERGGFDALDLEGIRRQFEVNAIGPLQVVHALRERIVDGGKIGLITSRMGSVEDNTSGGYYGYRASKAALNAMGKSLALDLAPHDISVVLLHPGFVATDMVGGAGDVTPDQAAKQLIQRIDALTPQRSGTFQHANGSALPW